MIRSPAATLAIALVAAVPLPSAGQEVEVAPHSVFQFQESASALAFSSDGARVLVGGEEGFLGLRDLGEDRTLWEEAEGSGERITFVSFLTDDTTVVSVDRAGEVVIRSAETGAVSARLETEEEPERVALDRARRVLAVAGSDARIELFDLPTRQRIGVIDARGEVEDPIFLDFDRRGRQLLAVGSEGGVIAWNPATLEPLRRVRLESSEIYGSRSVVHAVGQDRSANILVAALEEVALPRGGLRGRARPGDLVRRDQLLVFDWYSGAEIRRVEVTDGTAEVLAVGPGNDHAIVAHEDRVTVMDLRRGETGAAITAPGEVHRLVVSPDQDRLAIGTDDGSVAVWEMTYREATTVETLDQAPDGISGRLRVLGEDEPAIAPDSPIVMAILPFDDREGDGRMSQTVAELLVTQLANVEHLTLVERLRIQDLLDEQDLQRQGITEEGGMELGRVLNADYVLLGSIGASGSSFTFSARLLDVETSEVVSGRQVLCEECRAQDLFEAIHLLGTTIAR